MKYIGIKFLSRTNNIIIFYNNIFVCYFKLFDMLIIEFNVQKLYFKSYSCYIRLLFILNMWECFVVVLCKDWVFWSIIVKINFDILTRVFIILQWLISVSYRTFTYNCIYSKSTVNIKLSSKNKQLTELIFEISCIENVEYQGLNFCLIS